MALFFPKDTEKKIKYWNKKDMIGVIAKMSVNPKYYKKTKLPPKIKVRQDIFYDILTEKYKEGSPLRQYLMNTGDKYLIEFSRSGQTHPDRNRWAGMAVSTKEGYLIYGDNRMGVCLMYIRSNFL